MSDKQSKNTIKALIAVFVSVVIGEGIFGWGLYWPFLLILINWSGVYWWSLFAGILISVLNNISVGLPSLFIVFVIGCLSLFMRARKEMGIVILIISIMANFVFDKVFGLPWSVLESITLIIVSAIAISWFEKGESIRLNY